MRPLNKAASFASIFLCAAFARAQTFTPSASDPNILVPASSVVRPGLIHTDYLMLNPRAVGNLIRPLTSAPSGYAPADIHRAYGIPATGGGDAIAVVDSSDLSSSLSDFNTFSSQFGLPQETSANPLASSNKVFQVVYASGTKPPDAVASGWAGEIALDIEWAHAMAPGAKIYLVEANADTDASLFGAVKVAAALPDVREVSMSWGQPEFAGETALDSTFHQPGVAYFASSGDSAVQEYPSESPNLVSVGGTSLNVSPTGYGSESGWDGSGGGLSNQEPRPHFQDVVQPLLGSFRGDPDCSAVADPNTGVAVFSTQAFPGQGNWEVFGGTSVACPVVAGITNDREYAENSFSTNSSVEEQRIYGSLMGCYFRDITTGFGNGSCKVGWDFVTGVGTPNGIIPAWAKFGGAAENTANGVAFTISSSERWADTTGGGIETSAVTGPGSLVYFGSNDDNLYAVNSIDGSLEWQFATSGPIRAAPAVGTDGTVYVASEDGNLYALNGLSGGLQWKFMASQPIASSPTISTNGIIYFGCENGTVFALTSTGTDKWMFTANRGIESSPVIDPAGNIVIGCDTGQLFSLNDIGFVNWSLLTGGAIKSSPAMGPNGLVIVGSEDSNIYAVNGTTGMVAWKFQTGGPVDSAPSVSPNDLVYVGSADSNLYCLNAYTGAQAWKFQTGGPIASTPAVDTNGVVYIGSSDNSLYAVQGTGALSWSFATGGAVASMAIGGDGTLFFGSMDHKLYAVGGSVLANFSVAPSLVTAGGSATGTVVLPGPAPAAGISVALSSSTSAASVPASVLVSSGQLDGSFNVTTTSVPSTETVTLTASLLGGSMQAMLTLEPSPFANFYLSTASVTGGLTVSGVVQLQSPASGSGQSLTLSSNNSCATLPAEVTVASGSKGISFVIDTLSVSSAQTVTLGATIGSSEATTTLAVNPYGLTTFYLSTNTVLGLTGLRGVVRLAGIAGPGGNVVSLKSDNSAAIVPANVNVPAGSAAVSFAISTVSVSTLQSVTLTASFGRAALQAELTVKPYSLSSFTIFPTQVLGKSVTYGVIRLTGPAAAGGDMVSMSSNTPWAVPPVSVTVPAGKTAVSFPITTSAVSSPQTAAITASFNNLSLTATLGLEEAPIASFSLSPATVVGGNLTHGIIRLSGQAGPVGNFYSLTSTNSAASFTDGVAEVPGGSTAVSFVINTSGVASSQTSTIEIIGADTSSAAATLTINPAALVNFYFSPSMVKGGAATVGVLQLNGQAPPGSINVTMASDNNAVMFAPSPIQIFQGKTAATFSVQPAAVQGNTTVTVTAVYGGVTLQAKVTVTP